MEAIQGEAAHEASFEAEGADEDSHNSSASGRETIHSLSVLLLTL